MVTQPTTDHGSFVVVCDTSDDRAWKTARTSGIGASEIAILLGCSDWGSPLDLYYQKIGDGPEQEDEQSEVMLLGIIFESAIRDEVLRRANANMMRGPRLLRSTVYPWAVATPDGMTVDLEPIEVKNISYGFDPAEWEERIPDKYYYQVQHQMLVIGAHRALFGAGLWGSRIVWEWVERDEHAIAEIVRAGEAFWDRVQRREPPDSIGHRKDRKALALRAVDDDAVELYEQQIADKLLAWETAKADHTLATGVEKRMKKTLDAAADSLAQEMVGHRSGYTHTGWNFRWVKSERRGYTVKPSTVESFKIEPPKGE